MPETSNITGITAIFAVCGTFILGIFSKTGIDKQIKNVDGKVNDLKGSVVYEDRFKEYKDSQTKEHLHIADALKDIQGDIKELLSRGA